MGQLPWVVFTYEQGLVAGHVVLRHGAIAGGWSKAARDGQNARAFRLLHVNFGAGERQVGDLLGPVRVGAVRRAGDDGNRSQSYNAKRRVAVLDFRCGDGLTAGNRDRGGVLPGRLVASLVGAGGGHIGGCFHYDQHIAVTESGQRTGRAQR